MGLIHSVAPAGVASGPLPNALAQAVAQATGVAGSSPTAKLLLSQAVVPGAVIPAYTEAPKHPKSLLRPTMAPSTAFAAQFLAQTDAPSEEALAVFTPPSPSAPAPKESEAFLAGVRLMPPEGAKVPVAATAPAAAQAHTMATQTIASAWVSAAPTERPPVSQKNNSVVSLAPRTGFSAARGAQAYAHADARAGGFIQKHIEAVM